VILDNRSFSDFWSHQLNIMDRDERERIRLRRQMEMYPFNRRCFSELTTSQLELLRQNHPSINEPYQYFGRSCYLLGRALVENTHLRALALSQAVLSEADAGALSEGISQSKLESLAISCKVQVPERIWSIVYQGIQASQTIQKLSFGQVPVDAVVSLGNALPLMMSLRALFFKCLTLTEPGAQALGRGIIQSKLKRLALSNCIQEQPEDSGNIRLILYQGIQASPTMQELSFIYQFRPLLS
jgi:hypothetical protein